MSQQKTSRATRYLPQVVVATACVAVLPIVVVWGLLAGGVISSPWVCLGLAIALSLAASLAGSAYWKRHGGHGDVLFSELLLWGWLHRYRAERRIDSAVDLLGLANPDPRSAQTEESVQQTAQVLRQMAAALDAQDPYTDGHSRRVALHAAMIARKMDLPSEEIAKVRSAAAVHDIGKLRIPPEILHKPAMLTAAEFEVVKRHVDDGAEIVSVMEDPDITATVRHHHERFDGDGYPDGLVGREIPLPARVIAVADTFDALTSARPYRAAVPHKQALAIIVDASGTQLDPAVVHAFLRCYSARRWVVFWALLAASPQRALSAFTGTRPGHTSLASSATAAVPAAVTAVVVAAVGAPGGTGRTQDGVRLAPRASAQVAAGPNASTGSRSPGHRRVARHASGRARSLSPLTRQMALGISGTQQRGSNLFASVSSSAGSGLGSAPGAGGGTGTPSGGGTGRGSGGGGGSPKGGGGVTRGSPTHQASPITTPAGQGGTSAVSGTQGTSSPPSGSGAPADGGPGGGTPGVTGTDGPGGAGGSSGGSGSSAGSGTGNPANGGGASGGGAGGSSSGSTGSGGGAGGGSSGGGGGGGGSGGGGGNHPHSKADCKNGGFVSFGFPNQGQCVAWVEHFVVH